MLDVRPFPAFASALAVLLLLITLGVSAVRAQEQPATPPAAFPQEQIEAFADAALEVQRVQQDYNAQVQGVEDAEEIGRLQQEAQQEAIQAVEGTGLSAEEYGAIAEAANQDPQLYAMIVDLMQQRAD